MYFYIYLTFYIKFSLQANFSSDDKTHGILGYLRPFALALHCNVGIVICVSRVSFLLLIYYNSIILTFFSRKLNLPTGDEELVCSGAGQK